MAKKQEQSLSEYIGDFCKVVNNAQKDYRYSSDEISRLDKMTQDYLHLLELGGLKYKERAKLATELQKCRQLRREHKDIVDSLAPLVNFLGEKKNENMMNQLREVLGRVRRVEKSFEYRVYVPRVLDIPNISSHKKG